MPLPAPDLPTAPEILPVLEPYVDALFATAPPVDPLHIVLAGSALLATVGATVSIDPDTTVNPLLSTLYTALTVIIPLAALPGAVLLGYLSPDPMYVLSYELALGIAYHQANENPHYIFQNHNAI